MNNQVRQGVYRPEILEPDSPSYRTRLSELRSRPGLMVYDTIESQVSEWIKTLHPERKFSSQELSEAAGAVLGSDPDGYGCWVYYPWSNRLVHTLPEADFIKVRTSRNHYKITPQEQALLKQKRIGIIGLSVGQSVSVTLAMERIGGELRLADFDNLELTNLNRIRTGIHNLGLPKVYSVAREIAEIDPFLKVLVFPQGLRDDNMEAFFLDGGKIDLLIEESDGFDIKVLSRYYAREQGVPVLMEASDRCMVDVERFDLEPGRKILHGLIDHLDVQTLRSLKTTEEKIPYMLDVLGLDTASPRLKASMLEIEQSINTWPQLASAVTMGGGIAADVARRLLLDQFRKSGRFYIDVDTLIGDDPVGCQEPVFSEHHEALPSWNFSPEGLSRLHIGEAPQISRDLLMQWVEAACMAPSAGNNQPWAFAAGASVLYVFHDNSRCQPWSDSDGRLAELGIGACIENLVLASALDGYHAEVNYAEERGKTDPVAKLLFRKDDTQRPHGARLLMANSIALRCTNRKKALPGILEEHVRKAMEEVLETGYSLHYAGGEERLNSLADLVSEVEQIRFLNPVGHREFFTGEMRWNDEQVRATRDGLDVNTLELDNLERTGIKVAANPEIVSLLRDWRGGKGLGKATRDAIRGSDALVLLKGPGKSTLEDGRMLQRVWLILTALERSFHPVSAPVFFFDRKNRVDTFNSSERASLDLLEKRFLSFFPQEFGKKNIFLFRLAKSEPPVVRSLRRPPMIEFLNIPTGHV